MDEINILSHRVPSVLCKKICQDIRASVETGTRDLSYTNRRAHHYTVTFGVELSSRRPGTIKLWNLLVCYKHGHKIRDTEFLDFAHRSVF
jgi:hypothetical protein